MRSFVLSFLQTLFLFSFVIPGAHHITPGQARAEGKGQKGSLQRVSRGQQSGNLDKKCATIV